MPLHRKAGVRGKQLCRMADAEGKNVGLGGMIKREYGKGQSKAPDQRGVKKRKPGRRTTPIRPSWEKKKKETSERWRKRVRDYGSGKGK